MAIRAMSVTKGLGRDLGLVTRKYVRRVVLVSGWMGRLGSCVERIVTCVRVILFVMSVLMKPSSKITPEAAHAPLQPPKTEIPANPPPVSNVLSHHS